MNGKKYILLAVAFAIIISAAVLAYNYMTDSYKPAEPQMPNMTIENEQEQPADSPSQEDDALPPAPDFTVINGEGKEVKLSDFKGKPVVVNFWASWCGPCKSEFPAFEKMYAEYGDKIEFLMVNMTDGQQEKLEDVQAFVKDNNYKFPVYYDTNLSAAYTYNVVSIPMTMFVDSHGNFVKGYRGAIREDTLKIDILSMIEGE